MDEATANLVFDILVKHAGADWYDRADFVYHQSKEGSHCVEYRFQGALGFGGKFWNDNNSWWVNCYNEDMTPGKELMIRNTNDALHKLQRDLG